MKDPARRQKIEQLFQAAIELAPDQRSAFLDTIDGDSSLRSQVESLLSAHAQAASFTENAELNETAWLYDAPTMPLSVEEQEPLSGRRIGTYKVIREIGFGGMGTVYLAERDDDNFQKQVAIKVVKRGMDTDFVVRRFRNERQILASLDHPNIARLLDGGTTDDGLPYFVMEYIEGQPISNYCDSRRLTTVERLDLFRKVCSAVHYAHQNLVIHRDIKPANILVTEDGTPKLLDFGIAKLLDPDSVPHTVELTAASMRLLTPEFASPEQVKGEPITTATDIYSLGVVLYELLTGHRPYRVTGKSALDWVRVICDEEPERPSTKVRRDETAIDRDGQIKVAITAETVSHNRNSQPDKLRRRLKGDIDNIVLRAIRKEPQRRYASADQFANDIKRHIDGLPVIARKDTFLYRAAKFVRRNRAAVAVAMIIAAVIAAGVISTMIQRARAERRFNDVRKLANSFMFEIHDCIQDLSGSTGARALLVKRALEYLDSLARESSNDASLQRELATSFQKVGEVQGRPSEANLGDTAGAMESYKKAHAIRESLVAADPRNSEDRRMLALIYSRIAELLEETGEPQAAMQRYQESLAIRQELYSANPADRQSRRELATSYFEIGESQSALGDLNGALESRQKMLPIFESLADEEPSNAVARRNVSLTYKKLGATYARMGRFDEALEYYGKARERDEMALAADPANASRRMDLSFSISDYGWVLGRLGRNQEALASYRRALEIREALAAADPNDGRARSALSTTNARVGSLLSLTGDFAGSASHLNKAIAISEAIVASDPTNISERANLAVLYIGAGDALLLEAKAKPGKSGDAILRNARLWFQRSLEVAEKNYREKGEQVTSKSFLDEVKQKIATTDEALKHK